MKWHPHNNIAKTSYYSPGQQNMSRIRMQKMSCNKSYFPIFLSPAMSILLPDETMTVTGKRCPSISKYISQAYDKDSNQCIISNVRDTTRSLLGVSYQMLGIRKVQCSVYHQMLGKQQGHCLVYHIKC